MTHKDVCHPSSLYFPCMPLGGIQHPWGLLALLRTHLENLLQALELLAPLALGSN